MGIPIKAPIVHEEVAKTSFRANGIAATLLEVISSLCILLLPLLVGFSLGQFWITLDTFAVRMNATYTGKAMARAVAYDGTEYLWSTSPRLEEMLEGDDRAMRPFASVFSDDRDSDGRPDAHTFNFLIPLRTESPIATFHFLPAFDVRFHNDLLNVSMEAAPLVTVRADAATSTGGGFLRANGRLTFHQTQPLESSRWVRYDVIYRRSYLDDVRDVSDIMSIAEYGARYAARNETTPFITDVEATSMDATDGPNVIPAPGQLNDAFGVQIHMRVPLARVDYVPSFGESLKHGWVQYFCIAYIFWWAFGIVKSIAVSQALVNTIAEVRGYR